MAYCVFTQPRSQADINAHPNRDGIAHYLLLMALFSGGI